MTKKPVLIFPAGMPRSLEYLQRCLQEGRSVVGSSSLAYDPSRDKYPAWVHLPYVTDPAFPGALRQVATECDIGEIYTPNFGVWNYLNQNLDRIIPGMKLANVSPVDEVLRGYRDALVKARHFCGNPISLSSETPCRASPSEIELAALSRYAEVIPGMCDDDKFHALLEIARRAVSGDIVEVGSWWGKSAFIFSWLARHFGIGKLLCVDPWDNQHLVQGERIVDSGSAQVDAEEALRVFQIGLLPFSANHINYLRMTSVEGAASYANSRSVATDAFGTTEYAGRISILHIDGNHAYEAVKADIDSWGGFVANGGWIVFDDYVWPYGNGPQRAGDEFLEYHRAWIATAFVMGTALFVQLATNSTMRSTCSPDSAG